MSNAAKTSNAKAGRPDLTRVLMKERLPSLSLGFLNQQVRFTQTLT